MVELYFHQVPIPHVDIEYCYVCPQMMSVASSLYCLILSSFVPPPLYSPLSPQQCFADVPPQRTENSALWYDITFD